MAPAWLSAALEPVRAAYFPELSLWQPLLADFTAPAALLAGRAADGTLKEVVVLQRTAAVLVYNVVEHGRRWHRTLVFCGRTDVSLATLPLSLAKHTVPAGPVASSAAGFVCGDASTSAPAAASLVITRQARDTAVREGRRAALSIEQTFVPRRLLSGTLPESLLEAYTFWHTPDDGLTGYLQASLLSEPAARPSLLYVTLAPGASSVLPNEGLPPPRGGGSAPSTGASVVRRRVQLPPTAHDRKSGAVTGRQGEKPPGRESPRTTSPAVGTYAHALPAGDKGPGGTAAASDMGSLPVDDAWEPVPASQGGGEEVLLDLVHAAAGSKLAQLAALFSRLDNLSHVLAWARCDAAKEASRPQPPHDATHEAAADEKGWAASGLPLGLALVELPRLRLSFAVRLQRWGVAAGGAGSGAPEEDRPVGIMSHRNVKPHVSINEVACYRPPRGH